MLQISKGKDAIATLVKLRDELDTLGGVPEISGDYLKIEVAERVSSGRDCLRLMGRVFAGIIGCYACQRG